MVGAARRRRVLRAIVAHRHQFHRDPRTARDGADDADEGNRAEHAPRPLEARTEVDDIDRAAVLRLQPGDEDRGIVAIAGRRLDLSREAKAPDALRSEEHTSELQSLMRISYAVFCLKKKIQSYQNETIVHTSLKN